MKPSERASQAISLSQLRVNLFPIFNLMRDTYISFKVSYHSKIYIISIEPTSEVLRRKYRRSKTNARNKIDPNLIESKLCPTCGDLTLNNLCMNIDCDTNQKKVSSHDL